jgi:hypothetical protein
MYEVLACAGCIWSVFIDKHEKNELENKERKGESKSNGDMGERGRFLAGR